MKRLLISSAVMLPIVALLASMPAIADVKTREKTQIKFEGMLGRMVGMFGGKAAKEGVISSTAVKGNRKARLDDTTGQIVDLSEEKVYDLDVKKKTYQVTTFDEIRRRMREAREKAEREAAKEQGKPDQSAKTEKPEKEVEVDFDVKETGQKKSIAGHETREVVMTVTIREKGKTLEDGGGLVMTADSWVASKIPALKELADFELRYWQQIQGADAVGMSPEQMAMVLAQYPMVKNAMERLQKEGSKLEGTPLATTTTFEAVKSKEQLAAEAEHNKSSGGSGGGLGGMLAKKMMKSSGDPKPRATIFTTTHEFLEVATSVAAGDLDIPAGFKEKK
jgi:DNA invertase Pin-like site-specific DNA recombinase